MDTLKYNAGRHAIHPCELDRLAEFINSDRINALREKYGGDLFDYFAPSAKVVPGRYRIEHYYDHIGDKSDIYSKITKVG